TKPCRWARRTTASATSCKVAVMVISWDARLPISFLAYFCRSISYFSSARLVGVRLQLRRLACPPWFQSHASPPPDWSATGCDPDSLRRPNRLDNPWLQADAGGHGPQSSPHWPGTWLSDQTLRAAALSGDAEVREPVPPGPEAGFAAGVVARRQYSEPA